MIEHRAGSGKGDPGVTDVPAAATEPPDAGEAGRGVTEAGPAAATAVEPFGADGPGGGEDSGPDAESHADRVAEEQTGSAPDPAPEEQAAAAPAPEEPAAGPTAGPTPEEPTAGSAADPAHDEPAAAVAPPTEGSTAVVQEPPAPTPEQLRADFGAHLEANYQRLVAQLFAVTLDAGEAHEAVQEAYSRAWREWPTIGRSADPTAWVRRVAVRTTMRSWRTVLARLGIGGSRVPEAGAADLRTAALLDALRRLPVAERRSVVLFHMVGMSLTEIAALERVSQGSVQARLSRGRLVVSEGMADVLAEVLGPYRGGGYW